MNSDLENPTPDKNPENSEDVPMPITAHLSELRTRLVYSIIAILGVFVVATANNFQALPLEIIRKGRFDEIFFVNLPDNFAQKGVFKHMYIGRLNKGLTQKFIRLNLRHHLRLCRL